jgi:hypothetical protein
LIVYGRVHELTLGSTGLKLDFVAQRLDQTITISPDINNPTCDNNDPSPTAICVHILGS